MSDQAITANIKVCISHNGVQLTQIYLQ